MSIDNTNSIAKIADSLGNAAQVKFLSNNDVIISTDINNGSLIKLLDGDNSIVTYSTTNERLYVDNFNNLVFVHDGSSHVVPPPNPVGVYGV